VAIDDKAAARRLADWWPDYDRSIASLRASTQNGYRAAWRLRINPVLGTMAVRRISGSTIDGWLLGMQEAGVSPGKITEAHGVLRRLLERAVRDRAIPRNPCMHRTEKLPTAPQTDRPVLSPAEIEKLAAAMPTDLDRIAVRLMVYGGLRIGEVLGLRWEDVDLAARTLTVRRNINDSTGKLVVERPKNGIVRVVTLPDSLVDQLRDIAGTGVLYPNAHGNWLRYRNWRRDVWNPAVEVSGVAALPHDLRATTASLLIDAGASVKDVQLHLGHQDAETTMRHYERVRPGRNAEIVDRLDALIAEAE
jgi:integrase